MKWFIIIILIAIVLFLCIKKTYEGFENAQFDMYVITLKNPERIKNIKEQESKIGKRITIFDAVKGDDLDLDELIKSGTLLPNNFFHDPIKQKKREVGCYLSHYRIYEKINPDSNYTIIFEDDFSIKTDNFMNKVKKAIDILDEKGIDFDILFLGNHAHNENHGTPIVDNLYKVGSGESLGGTQGYVVRNKNVKKIINHTKRLDYTIDVKIQRIADDGLINVVSIYPYYVDQGPQPSTIAVSEGFYVL